MTLDDILAEFRTSPGIPRDALRAAVGMADALAPIVYERHAQFCKGICLLTADENVLFHGLHVLAAARHGALGEKLVELARLPEDELGSLFADHAPISLAAMMLSVWDGDAGALLRRIEHADMGNDGKWALFDVLARLTFDGRIPHDVTVDFLTRYEQDGLADPDSELWWGWQNAVTLLGLVELEPALQRAWQKPIYAHFTAKDHAECISALRMAAAAPGDSKRFEEAGIRAVDDPVEALAWLERRAVLDRQWKLEHPESAHMENDPAKTVRLGPDDEHWLGRFLVSRQALPSTMSLYMLDGYLTALIIGPLVVPPEKYLPDILGDATGEAQPNWTDQQQREHVLGLIARIADAIAIRREAAAPHVPLVIDGAPSTAAEWAEGFAIGMDLDEHAWDALFADERGAEEGLEVLALCEGETEFLGREATQEEKARICARLPHILQRIAAYWRDPVRRYPRTQPVRIQKIGRNDPCPCGSGKKYKKCCALNPPPTLN